MLCRPTELEETRSSQAWAIPTAHRGFVVRYPLAIRSSRQLMLLAMGLGLLTFELAAQPAVPPIAPPLATASSDVEPSAPKSSDATSTSSANQPGAANPQTGVDSGVSPGDPSVSKPDGPNSGNSVDPVPAVPPREVPPANSGAQPKPIPKPADITKLLTLDHPWSGFPVGSWKLVRTFSETLDGEGEVKNITATETRTTLVAMTGETYTLRVEVTVEVGGKRFPPNTHLVKKSTRGVEGPDPEVVSLADSELVLDGRKIACQVRMVSADTDDLKVESLLFTSDDTYPHIVRRETESTSSDGRSTSTLVEVIATGLPFRILGDTRPTATIRTTQKHAMGSTITLETHSPEIPGGLVAHSALEMDAEGKPLRRSTLELLAYGNSGEQLPIGQRRRFYRNRGR